MPAIDKAFDGTLQTDNNLRSEILNVFKNRFGCGPGVTWSGWVVFGNLRMGMLRLKL